MRKFVSGPPRYHSAFKAVCEQYVVLEQSSGFWNRDFSTFTPNTRNAVLKICFSRTKESTSHVWLARFTAKDLSSDACLRSIASLATHIVLHQILLSPFKVHQILGFEIVISNHHFCDWEISELCCLDRCLDQWLQIQFASDRLPVINPGAQAPRQWVTLGSHFSESL